MPNGLNVLKIHATCTKIETSKKFLCCVTMFCKQHVISFHRRCIQDRIPFDIPHVFSIRHNSADSVPTSNHDCIKTASILNYRSRDLKYGGTFRNHCKVIILSMKSLARLKYQTKSLEFQMFVNEIDFNRLFDGILKVVFSFSVGSVSIDNLAENRKNFCEIFIHFLPYCSYPHLNFFRFSEKFFKLTPFRAI